MSFHPAGLYSQRLSKCFGIGVTGFMCDGMLPGDRTMVLVRGEYLRCGVSRITRSLERPTPRVSHPDRLQVRH